MTAVRALADRYLDDLVELRPDIGTSLGLGDSSRLPDLSPDGVAAQAALAQRALGELAATPDEDEGDSRCRALVQDRLGLVVRRFDAGEHLRELSVIAGAPQTTRSVFDLMPIETVDDWDNIAQRMAAVPATLSSFQSALADGLRRHVLAAPRQALGTADQLDTWAGRGGEPFFATLCRTAPEDLPAELVALLEANADRATESCAALADWLRATYAPAVADVPDPVGRDHYVVAAREHLGCDVDPEEAYAWAWEELARIEADMRETAARIRPGVDVFEVMDWLDTHGEAVEGEDNLRAFLQDLMDTTIDALDGTHFDLAPPLRVVEAKIAPPGGAAAQYYTPPSADFSRPGRTWYPTMGRTRFPVWNEVSTCYHEGVPGHHLQLAQWIYTAPQSSLFQSTFFVSGNGEGWALYSERLMDELGYFTDAGRRLGFLEAQQLRATRVVVDIGMHLAMTIPTGQPFHPGERFTPELGREFMALHAGRDPAFLDSEWERYLGWPGQAICYKLGERVWLAGRDAARQRAAAEGRPFDLKAWHMAALSMGSTGLDHLAAELPLL